MVKKELTIPEIKKKFRKYRRIISLLEDNPDILTVVNTYHRLHYKKTRKKLSTVIRKIIRILRYKNRSKEFYWFIDFIQ